MLHASFGRHVKSHAICAPLPARPEPGGVTDGEFGGGTHAHTHRDSFLIRFDNGDGAPPVAEVRANTDARLSATGDRKRKRKRARGAVTTDGFTTENLEAPLAGR